jgi:anti-sigma regulatory factor (Ser/Thr protein kinase)
MQTFNTYFHDKETLEEFISSNKEIKNSNSLLVQIFSGIIDTSLLASISSTILDILPQANIIGATTDGEILGGTVSTEKIVLSFTIFNHTSIEIAYVSDNEDMNSYDSGKELMGRLKKENTKLSIIFASGLYTNGEEFLNGVNSISDTPVSGGLSGDNAKFKSTYVIYNNQIISHGAVGVSLNSDILQITSDYSLNWIPIGKTFVVEESTKNIIYKIDGVTPYELYEKYLGEDIASRLPHTGVEFPLLIEKENITIARAVLGKGDDGSLIFAGNIPKGSKVRLGIGNIDAILSGSKRIAEKFNMLNSESIFVYSCMARRRFLDTNAYIETRHFANMTSVSGFFTYGEFQTVDNKHELLNESLTLVSLSELDNADTNKINNNQNIDYEKEVYDENHLSTFRALSHIINITSDELINLNENLEEKINSETQKNIQHKLKLFEQAKMASMGEMIGNIAHQWRQPLSVISTITSGIKYDIKLGMLETDKLAQKMDKVTATTQYLSSVIDTFRNYIKEEKVIKTVVFQDRVNMAINLVDTVLKEHRIKLINNISYEEPINIRLQVGELVEIIINLINNAKDVLVQKKIEDPWIKLDLEVVDRKLYFSIEDNAGGIPENIIDKIFDPYFTTKHKSQGTGLGLYMSKQIVTQSLHGNLIVSNTDNGAKFTIEIPCVNHTKNEEKEENDK